MNVITERQKNILDIVVREYIDHATPISSQFIEKKYDLGISPATIRAELYNLAIKGYLYQPHTSAGRVPTDMGYRFFVDTLSKKEIKQIRRKVLNDIKNIQQKREGKIKFMRQFTRFLAESSSSLTISYFPQQNILFKEGWQGVVQGPEFNDIQKIHALMGMVSDFEDNIDSFLLPRNSKFIRIYIGKEAPFSKHSDFSIMISSCRISNKWGLLAMIGPKRMNYDRNIHLVESIIKSIQNHD